MSIIAAGTTTTTALSSTGNTDGTLQFQVNGTTPSVTLNTLGAIGVGASPAFGTSGQVLTSAGSTAAPTWVTPQVTLAGTQTLTNKTIAFADNTLTGVAGTTATQTLTNKTIEAGVFTNGYTEEVVTANTGTAYTINLANGTVQYLTLTGNCTYTFPTPVAGQSFILIQRQDGTGGRTVTWPASVDWPGATAPTLTSTANRVDKFVFTAIDGSNWLGSNAGQNYTV